MTRDQAWRKVRALQRLADRTPYPDEAASCRRKAAALVRHRNLVPPLPQRARLHIVATVRGVDVVDDDLRHLAGTNVAMVNVRLDDLWRAMTGTRTSADRYW